MLLPQLAKAADLSPEEQGELPAKLQGYATKAEWAGYLKKINDASDASMTSAEERGYKCWPCFPRCPVNLNKCTVCDGPVGW